MSEEIKARQLGTDHEPVLRAYEKATVDWLLPFLRLWMSAGQQPIVSEAELAGIRSEIASWQDTKTVPDGFAWLPDLLSRLAENKRFNRRNLVNIHPAPHIPAILASTVVAFQNPNNIVRDVSGPTTDLERQCIQWMAAELLGFDAEEAWGNVVSGGTVANMTALLVARDYSYRKLARPRPAGVRQRGLFGMPAGIVLATKGSHYSLKKALWFLGLGDENLVAIPSARDEIAAVAASRDELFLAGITKGPWKERIRSAANEDEMRGKEEFAAFYAGKAEPFSLQPLNSEIFKALYGCFEYGTPLLAFVLTVGTTDTGTIENPSTHALDVLAEEDVFIHADAAIGGFALRHERVRRLVRGLERVNSATIDGHKFGHLAYPNGALIFRERGWMYEVLHEAPYLQGLAPTLEGSRPGSHIAALWAVLQDLGESGRLETWLDRLFSFVSRLRIELNESCEFQVLHEVHLTTIAIAPVPHDGEARSDLNHLVIEMEEAIKRDVSADAFLVNIDRGLSGIKVRESGREPAAIGEGWERDPLVDLYCLRVVATNPIVEPDDATPLVEYLERQLELARRRVARGSRREQRGR